MNIIELIDYLDAQGYDPNSYHVGEGWDGKCNDVICIAKGKWFFEVFYVERGQNTNELFVSVDENAACKQFIEELNKLRI